VTKRVRAGIAAAVAVLFIGLFVSALGVKPLQWGTNKPTRTPPVVKWGNFGKYLYGISNISSSNKKVAQYDPTLPSDDSVVVPALKELSGTGLGVPIAEATEPVVETIDETNYVTFTVGNVKVLFELFRNSSGQVGTVRFWKQTL
jgi:hypothetical protein